MYALVKNELLMYSLYFLNRMLASIIYWNKRHETSNRITSSFHIIEVIIHSYDARKHSESVSPIFHLHMDHTLGGKSLVYVVVNYT